MTGHLPQQALPVLIALVTWAEAINAVPMRFRKQPDIQIFYYKVVLIWLIVLTASMVAIELLGTHWILWSVSVLSLANIVPGLVWCSRNVGNGI